MEKGELRTLFESEYPGKKAIFEKLIQPIFKKAKDTTLSNEIDITEGDKKQIKSFSIIAQVRGGFPIAFADVEVQDSVALKRSRVTIQNCVRKMMENDSNAIIFFHFSDDKSEWRVSFCHRADKLKESTDAKRFTYLCGTEHACRTIAERFETLKGLSTIKDEDLLEAFSVEPLSKEFFDEYREHYADLVEYISGKRFVKKGGKFVEEKIKNAAGAFREAFEGDDKKVRDFVKKMMGRLVFLQFLQKKGWLGVQENAEWGSGDKNFIYNLFRNASKDVQNDFLEKALEPLFFKSLNQKRDEKAIAPEELCTIYGSKIRIPYLNGGLFEEDELDKKKVKFKKEHFEQLLTFFNQYNFTIDETDGDDQEIGVDPEMLGKIFENLLEDNKDKGAFYTPKEIVQYMCRESLIAYLNEKLKIESGESKIRNFVLSHDSSQFNEGEKSTLLHSLLDVKICDPAVGSGAFPMGMMNELLSCTQVLTGNAKSRSDLKKHIVKNNIYGVDIEKGAVDIARLRFWLAIIVDEEEPLPLPNLDYKIMQGNSLLESFNGIDLSNLCRSDDAPNLFDDTDDVKALLGYLNSYFDKHEEKGAIRDAIKASVLDLLRNRHFSGESFDALSELDLHENSEFFLWHTWFGDVFNRPNDRNGFDIVIGNPPYVKKQNISAEATYYYNNNYSVAYKNYDLYIIFTELGYNLLKTHGFMSYIMPKKFITTEYGKLLKEFIYKNRCLKKYIDFDLIQVFENATNYVGIFELEKVVQKFFNYYLATQDKPLPDVNDLSVFSFDRLSTDKWIFEDEKKQEVFKKIQEQGPRLSTVTKNISQGLVTGMDKVFVLQKNENGYYSKFLDKTFNFKQSKIFKPLLKGKEINRYTTPSNSYCIIYPYELTNDDTVRLLSLREIRKIDPEVADYLMSCKKSLILREGWMDDTNFYAYSRNQNIALMPKRKILTQVLSLHSSLTFDTNGDYCFVGGGTAGGYTIILKDEKQSLYYLGLMNSTLLEWFIHKYASPFQGGYYAYNKTTLSEIPIPAATPAQQKPIIALVDKILAAKKANPQADTSKEEAEIDRLVYQLYGLSEDEIKIVEGK